MVDTTFKRYFMTKNSFVAEVTFKTDIEKLSKRRTHSISGQFFLHQRCPLIGENTVSDTKICVTNTVKIKKVNAKDWS